MAKIVEKLKTVPSYIEGETFTFSVPHNIETLDCKLNQKAGYGEMLWSPWPSKIGIERRVGPWLLKLHDTLYTEKGWGKNRRKIPFTMIRPVDGDPEVWYVFNDWWDTKDDTDNKSADRNGGLPNFNGRHVLSVLKQDFPELDALPHKYGNEAQECPKNQKLNELRKPTPISKEILGKVFGRSHTRGIEVYTNFEHADRRNKFILDVEWYRKELLKIQRKISNEKKKELAEDLGVTVSDIEAQKREEQEIAKAAQLTQEWIDISGEVFKTIEFLNEVVKQMGQRKDLDREWFDKGRRAMRELANTMRPINKHFPKAK